MNRRDLQEAICDLEYLVINHFDPDRLDYYAEQLRGIREQLRALEATERYSGSVMPDKRAAVAGD